MKRHAARLLAVIAPLVTIAGGLGASACHGERSLVAAGGDCDLAIDCAPGLVCVEQQGGRRVCTSDLSRVAGRIPPDGAAPATDAEAGAEGGEGGGPAPDGGTRPPDGGPPAVPDAASPPDAGSLPADAATGG